MVFPMHYHLALLPLPLGIAETCFHLFLLCLQPWAKNVVITTLSMNCPHLHVPLIQFKSHLCFDLCLVFARAQRIGKCVGSITLKPLEREQQCYQLPEVGR